MVDDPIRQRISRLEAAVASLADRFDPMPDDQIRAVVDGVLARVTLERAARVARHEQRLAEDKTREPLLSQQATDFLAMINR